MRIKICKQKIKKYDFKPAPQQSEDKNKEEEKEKKLKTKIKDKKKKKKSNIINLHSKQSGDENGEEVQNKN